MDNAYKADNKSIEKKRHCATIDYSQNCASILETYYKYLARRPFTFKGVKGRLRQTCANDLQSPEVDLQIIEVDF